MTKEQFDGGFQFGIVASDKTIVIDNCDIWDGPFVWEDNFFHSGEWSETAKQRYREWLSRMPDDHPAKSDPQPWQPTISESRSD